MADNDGAGGAGDIDFESAPPPDTMKSVDVDAWAATPPAIRKAIYEREDRAKSNHGEQIARLTAKIEALSAAQEGRASQNGNGHEPAAKKPGIEGMELDELERYHDHAEEILARARKEPDNVEIQEKAAKLTPNVMRELLKAIVKKSSVGKDEIEALRAEIRGDKEAARLNGALNQKVVSEFGPASVLPGNAVRMAAEKAYSEIQQSIKDGLSPEAALQYAAYKIAAASGNRGGSTNGGEANGAGRLAEGGNPDVAGILRSLKTRSAALRAKGDVLGASLADVEAELFGTMPSNILNNGR